jgi:predicted  nucleic acid-binding Zn-ribbon protein
MKRWIYFTIALTITCLSSKAQYKLVTRGQVNTYDSAVVVELTQYRALRFKLTTADNYIKSLKTEIDTLRAENAAWRGLSGQLATLSSKHEQFEQVNANSFKNLNEKFNDLLREATKPKKWYHRTGVLICAGAVSAYILTR